MTIYKGKARAKVNLTLHITGQREDGYHLLDSLVVFADVGDLVAVAPAPDLRLTVSGPFSDGVPTDQSNLVLRAAAMLRTKRGVTQGASITLEKHLPNAAGIGGGSADAASILTLLADMWGVPGLDATDALALGADLPVCMSGPRPMFMRGIGDDVMPVPRLPEMAMVLVNPRVKVPTSSIFQGLANRANPAMTNLTEGLDFKSFVAWLKAQRNDLLPPARVLAPDIDAALGKLAAQPAVQHVGMSGSGATCWALVKNMADARHVARAVQVSEMSWWVVPAEVL